MLLDTLFHLFAFSVKGFVLVLIFLTFAYLVRNRFYHGLNKYPGPLLASLTNWWRLWDVWGRQPHITQAKLHQRYGNIVRLGPNYLSFAEPAALKDIYGLKAGTTKSDFYPVQASVASGHVLLSLFSTTDEKCHAALRRAVSNAFALSNLLQYEPFVDTTTSEFLKQLKDRFADRSVTFGFPQWLQYYAFDVIGELTYSHRHGFIDKGEDVDGIIQHVSRLLDYAAPIGQLPFLDKFLLKNPVRDYLSRLGLLDNTFPVVKFARARMAERKNDEENVGATGKPPDLLSKFCEASEKHPDVMTPQRVLTMAVSMALAGSETTAISLSAIFYYLLKNPRCYAKLIEEIDAADAAGSFGTNDTIPFIESQKLVYLDSCIKEAFRLHPAAGLPLERVAPPEGLTVAGEHIPGGTIVGCSAWLLHRRAEVFGDAVDEFRPERWLEADEASLREMNGTMFHFGAGARTCIGKNISLLEIYKVVPSLLRRFRIALGEPDRAWTVRNSWFVRIVDFPVRIEGRERGGR